MYYFLYFKKIRTFKFAITQRNKYSDRIEYSEIFFYLKTQNKMRAISFV